MDTSGTKYLRQCANVLELLLLEIEHGVELQDVDSKALLWKICDGLMQITGREPISITFEAISETIDQLESTAIQTLRWIDELLDHPDRLKTWDSEKIAYVERRRAALRKYIQPVITSSEEVQRKVEEALEICDGDRIRALEMFMSWAVSEPILRDWILQIGVDALFTTIPEQQKRGHGQWEQVLPLSFYPKPS